MNWGSLSDFLAMGGHGFYVWGSFGAALLVMVAEPLMLAQRRRAALRQLRRRARAEQFELQEQPT
ncbi:heme exporter protein CcmD [Ramlibacter albus]|uniref:Heme exporter protein D n=1 Tax=Ramlibacter albus TaxID=2079448 RepID=A0A923M6X7_9BURK|nr:heme exporter protein CcmD [Ramlibacter albus]MBC5764470.1 heme exporter protein CcmD [Ramlibacter albus]